MTSDGIVTLWPAIKVGLTLDADGGEVNWHCGGGAASFSNRVRAFAAGILVDGTVRADALRSMDGADEAAALLGFDNRS